MMLRSLNTAVRDVLGRAASFWISSATKHTLARSKAQREASPLHLWEPTIGTCWIIFSAWRKGFGLARSTTISGAGTRNWRIRWCAHVL